MSLNRSLLRSYFLLAVLLFISRAASASNPTSGYVVATKVEYFPDKANATSTIIHGAFFYWLNNFNYTTPKCGYMYFVCPQGQDVTMCRMQWSEIEARIGQQVCMGFGQNNMVEKATLRAEGTPPANPDPWDLGMGVYPASPNGAISQCQPALQLSCAASPPVDMAITPDSGQPPLAAHNSSCAIGMKRGANHGFLALTGMLLAGMLRRRRRV